MIIDGRAISKDIQQKLNGSNTSLGVIYVGSNPVIDNFIKIKKNFGEKIGASVSVYRLKSINKNNVKEIANQHTGIVIQLPMPKIIFIDEILNSIPIDKDIDVLSENAIKLLERRELDILPPVVGAVVEIFNRYNIKLIGKKIVIIGDGRLVGKPILRWFCLQNIKPVVLKKGDDFTNGLKDADIIISGIGKAGLIQPEMLKQGVVLIDAGTSEDPLTGFGQPARMVGDANLSCAEKCSIFTPVPGGVGPITVAILFRNLIKINDRN